MIGQLMHIKPHRLSRAEASWSRRRDAMWKFCCALISLLTVCGLVEVSKKWHTCCCRRSAAAAMSRILFHYRAMGSCSARLPGQLLGGKASIHPETMTIMGSTVAANGYVCLSQHIGRIQCFSTALVILDPSAFFLL